jgi:hypothetical protein
LFPDWLIVSITETELFFTLDRRHRTKEMIGGKKQFRKRKEFYPSNLEAVMSYKIKNIFHKIHLLQRPMESCV